LQVQRPPDVIDGAWILVDRGTASPASGEGPD
jgi:hypothetical protein